MAATAAASYTVLIVAAAVLFYAAASDLKAYKISNEVVITLLVLFALHSALSGRWVGLHWDLAFGAVCVALMLACYAAGLMGGGDLKLLSVAFLWTGIRCVVPFLLVVVAAALVHTLLARFGYVGAQRVEGRMRIAFAPSIAIGLIVVFMIGCVSPH